MSELDRFILRLDQLLDRLDPLLPPVPVTLDFAAHIAFRWRKRGLRGGLEPVGTPHRIKLDDLKGVERQAELVTRNSRQFVEGRPANNVLLTGARGTGKSSLVKAVLNEFAPRGLRLVEVEKNDLLDLPDIIDLLVRQPYRFVLFCDDLSFEADEAGYKALKAVLDGSVAATPDNVLLYATSNRRHLMPEYMQENLQTRYVGEEIHPSETVEEKVSLSERFGLWVSFYPFDQDEYLSIVRHWLERLGVRDLDDARIRTEALQWALMRGSRSGRVAWHFARDWAGRTEPG
ncbi:MAG: ATP-binding protein [Verrucomicrobia bacterium]|nr:ATP-binding protein [Verrucomicrobiota bacterium]